MKVKEMEDIVGCGLDKKGHIRYEIKWVNSWVDENFLKEMLPDSAYLRERMETLKSKFLETQTNKEHDIIQQVNVKEEPQSENDDELSQEGCSQTSTLFMCNVCNNAFQSHDALQKHQQQCLDPLDNAQTNSMNNQQLKIQQDNPLSNIVSELRKAKTCDTTKPQNHCEDQEEIVTDDLNYPLVIHECENCQMTFADAEYLIRHKVRCKNHAESSIRCEICNRGFTAKGSLELHIDAVHLKKKEFGCSLCGKLFSRKHILKVHLDTHYGKKDFECSVCGKKFLQKSNLNRHERIHEAKNYGYGCRFCGQAFTQNKHLKNHMVTLHPNEAAKEVANT